MAAPHIPNLLSLRGKPRSRGFTRKYGPNPKADTIVSQQRRDLDIQGTDTDAAVSRLSAVSLGYLGDRYASFFVQGPPVRRLPIINRGTYTRTIALDTLINSFLSANESPPDKRLKQIISLGAGTDTRYFRLRDSKKHKNVIYHEFDFPSASAAKKRIVMSHPTLMGNIKSEHFWSLTDSANDDSESKDWGFSRSDGNSEEIVYCFHSIDLRSMAGTKGPQSFLGLRTDVPTLILSECCLCYMDVIESSSVVKWFTEKIPSIGIILYEPIGSNDSFGQMMISNLAARNIVMPSLPHFNSLSDQRRRLSDFGFDNKDPKNGCEAETIENIWEEWVPAAEKDRVNHLEGLDEVEEWQMLAKHYAIVWGWRSNTNEWQNWAKMQN